MLALVLGAPAGRLLVGARRVGGGGALLGRAGGGGGSTRASPRNAPRARSSSVVGGVQGEPSGFTRAGAGASASGGGIARRTPPPTEIARARGAPSGVGGGGMRAFERRSRSRVRGFGAEREGFARVSSDAWREARERVTRRREKPPRVVVGGSREYQSGAQAQRRALGANSSSFSDASRPSRATWRDPVASSETTTRLGTRFRARSHAHDARRRPRPPAPLRAGRGRRAPRPPPRRASLRARLSLGARLGAPRRGERSHASAARVRRGVESGAGARAGARPSPRSSARTPV